MQQRPRKNLQPVNIQTGAQVSAAQLNPAGQAAPVQLAAQANLPPHQQMAGHPQVTNPPSGQWCWFPMPPPPQVTQAQISGMSQVTGPPPHFMMAGHMPVPMPSTNVSPYLLTPMSNTNSERSAPMQLQLAPLSSQSNQSTLANVDKSYTPASAAAAPPSGQLQNSQANPRHRAASKGPCRMPPQLPAKLNVISQHQAPVRNPATPVRVSYSQHLIPCHIHLANQLAPYL